MLTDEERSNGLQDLRGSPQEDIHDGIPWSGDAQNPCRLSNSIFAQGKGYLIGPCSIEIFF